MRLPYWFGSVLLCVACSESTGLDDATLNLYPGLEDDAWATPPAVRTIEVIREMDGAREPYATLDPPPTTGSVAFPVTGPTATFEAHGLDADGDLQLLGRSFPLVPDGLLGATISLFVGRIGRFSRPGRFTEAPGDAPLVGTLGGRFVITTGAELSSTVTVLGYDFGLWGYTGADQLTCPVPGDCKVRSMAVIDGQIVVLMTDAWANATNFSTGSTIELSRPSGLESFGEVAGGATVNTDELSAYLVGPTRDAPTNRVLRIALDGTMTVHDTSVTRAGAAATWIEARGLIVAAGSAEGPGVELLAASAREFSGLPFPADDTVGAALVPFDDSRLLRVGGRTADGDYAATVALDLDCSEDCAPVVHSVPVELERVEAFRLDAGILVVGTDAEGLTAVRLLDESGLTPVELREPRRGARAMINFLGQVAVIGGTLESGAPATSLELFLR